MNKEQRAFIVATTKVVLVKYLTDELAAKIAEELEEKLIGNDSFLKMLGELFEED